MKVELSTFGGCTVATEDSPQKHKEDMKADCVDTHTIEAEACTTRFAYTLCPPVSPPLPTGGSL